MNSNEKSTCIIFAKNGMKTGINANAFVKKSDFICQWAFFLREGLIILEGFVKSISLVDQKMLDIYIRNLYQSYIIIFNTLFCLKRCL